MEAPPNKLVGLSVSIHCGVYNLTKCLLNRCILQRIPRQIWLAFLPIFAIVLAVVLFLFQARIELLQLSAKYVALNTVFAVLISLGATTLLLAGFVVITKAWSRVLVRITLYTVARAVNSYTREVRAAGIAPREGSVVLRLAIGSNAGVREGDNFLVLNTTTRDEWGELQVIETEDTSCVCRVSDTMNLDFWSGLEQRMQRDPSPPTGVTFSRDVPEGFSDFVQRLVRSWGG